MTEKTKKYLAIGSGAVICAGLLMAISLRFGKAPADGTHLLEESSMEAQIVVNPESVSDTTEPDTEERTAFIRPDVDVTDNSETSQPADARPAQTDQSEQSIQPEVTKPAEPEESVKTNPAQKPDGTKVEMQPASVVHEEAAVPTETEPTAGPPQGGETQAGKVYLPGFGWVTDTGSSGTTADDMYENGNKIGDMGT